MNKKDCIKVEDAKRIIIENTQKPVKREKLIEMCVKTQNLTAEELADKTSGHILNVVKCRFGEAIQQLLNSGILKEDESKNLVCKNGENAVEQVERDKLIADFILKQLKKETLTKKQILEKVAKKLVKQGIKEQHAKSDAGRILSSLASEEKIAQTDGVYSLYVPEEGLNESNKRLLASLSDEALVEQSVLMLSKWFSQNGYAVTDSKNTDGPNDGGIDGKITARDGLGYEEVIAMQVKNMHKSSLTVKLCDVREFCGVLSAESEITKGVFVTSGKFHAETERFAKKFKTKYFMLIDGNKWLNLAEQCEYKIPNNI